MPRTLFFFALAASLLAQPPNLVLKNGRVWTGNASQPWAQALAMTGDRITAVGGDAQVARLAGPATRVIDLGGKFAMPGFNDAHIHFLTGSLGLREVDLTGACTIEEMQRRISEYALRNPDLEWITGSGWEYYCFPSNRIARKEDLDLAIKDRPAFIRSYDGHSAWANSRALRVAEINRDSQFAGFGEIDRDEKTKEPTGYLKEGATALVSRHLPKATQADKRSALERGFRLLASLGITSIQNASGSFEDLALYQEMIDKGKATARVSVVMSARDKNAPFNEWAVLHRQYERNRRLRMTGVKFMLDGVIESHTAALLAPYSDGTESSGTLNWNVDEYRDAVARADRLGLQIYTHAIGDRAVRVALDAYQYAVDRNGPRFHLNRRDRRFRIEHIETVAPEDLPRFAPLNVMAVMQPIHADPATVEVWAKALGANRTRRGFAWRSLERAGARLVFSSDWPACLSLDPLRGLHNAVNRRTTDGKPEGGWLPEQRVSVQSALEAYTRAGAVASFEESVKGTLEAGKLADVVVLSQDPFKVDPLRLHETKVVTTVFNGRVVYSLQ